MERKKIRDLSFSELEHILVENFSKIGIYTNAADDKLKRACESLFNYQANILVDILPVMFDMFAAGKIKVEKVKPDVNGYFFAQLKDGYFANAEIRKEVEAKRELRKLWADRERTAFVQFMKYCETYRKFPEVAPWVMILKYIVRKEGSFLYEGFDKEPAAIQIKTARVQVKKHASEWFANKTKIAFAA